MDNHVANHPSRPIDSPDSPVATQDLAALTRAQGAEFLPFDVQKASAGFPDGWDASAGKYSSQNEVSEFLKGMRGIQKNSPAALEDDD